MTGGELVLVSTPIGNLGDLSPRASEVLASADVICCEDTRHTGRLLSLTGIRAKRLLSLHAHNEAARTLEILDMLGDGAQVALVSDAGTPVVSDPGRRVVDRAIDSGFRVISVPGPSAVLAAIVVSGLASDRFRFEGFLPRRGRARAARLAEIGASPCPSVVFEAPLRVAATLGDLSAACGEDRVVAVCRELTKLHEETWRGPLSAALERSGVVVPRGEHVLVVDGAATRDSSSDGSGVADSIGAQVNAIVASGTPRRQASAEVAAQHGVSRRRAYEASLASVSRAEPADPDPSRPRPSRPRPQPGRAGVAPDPAGPDPR